jgi:hypothetical protein
MRCIDAHPSCNLPPGDTRPGGEAYMPTRVLDIGTVDDSALTSSLRASIRLVDSVDLKCERKYACLSHRWNTSGQTIKTERATYDKHKTSGIPFQDLDLAYQDTVHIMRRLRVQYLWIDSLCIVQDDPEDWETESQQMSMVYNRAVFTLARHCDSQTSLKRAVSRQILVSDAHSLPAVYARPRLEHFCGEQDEGRVYDSPLLSRGWVYQERILSPRIVHFSELEVSFECSEEFRCQCRTGTSFTEYGESGRGHLQ